MPKTSLVMSIKMSLLVAVVLLLAMLASVSIMARLRLSALEQSIETVGRDRLPRIRALGEIDLAVTRLRLSSVRSALAATEEERAEAKALIAERLVSLDKRCADFEAAIGNSPTQQLLFATFLAKWKTYEKYQAKILDVDLSANRVAIGHMVNVESSEPFQDVIDAIDDGIKYADEQADELIDQAKEQRDAFATALWIINGLSILVAFGTLIFVVRDVSNPIRRVTQSMERIAKGELSTEIPYAERRNELGRMARALAVFRKSLAENERLGAATRTLSELSEWLQSAKSDSELYDMIADVLARLMPECKGSLYIYANSRDLLESVKAWNGAQPVKTMPSDDCWGLRRGHTYVHGVGEIEFRCKHVHEGTGDDYCCIPILAHGEKVGLLHLEYLAGPDENRADAKQRFTDRQRLGIASAGHISMAIANVKLREHVRDQSVRDGLTGLYNRRYLLEAGRRELQRAAGTGAVVGVLSIDVDHFKIFNDTHGHDAGDTVLRSLGECMRLAGRDDDIACRFGGEEFVMLLPGLTVEAAAARAEELRARVEALTVRHADKTLPHVTLSVGVAAFPAAGQTLMKVLKVADEALYEAKRLGGNRVEASPGSRRATNVLAYAEGINGAKRA